MRVRDDCRWWRKGESTQEHARAPFRNYGFFEVSKHPPVAACVTQEAYACATEPQNVIRYEFVKCIVEELLEASSAVRRAMATLDRTS